VTENDMHELGAAYALDAVDDLERKAFEAHLAGCDSCQREVAAFRETAAHLGHGGEVSPPAAVKRSVMERIAAEPQTAARASTGTVTSQAPEGAHRGSRRRRSGWWVAAAATVVVGAAGVTYLESRPEEPGTLVAQVLADEEAVRASEEVDGATYTVVSSEDLGRTVIVAEEAPEPPTGYTYQLWYVFPDGRALSAGLLAETGEREEVLLDGHHPDAAAVGVTVEPAGGSEQPTTEPIVAVPLSG
jgi:anti-sigma-K factor RskA